MKQKKHWYDYLWIASLTYLVLGFFNILFGLAGPALLFYSSDYFSGQGKQGLLQPLLRKRTAVWTAGRTIRSVAKA